MSDKIEFEIHKGSVVDICKAFEAVIERVNNDNQTVMDKLIEKEMYNLPLDKAFELCGKIFQDSINDFIRALAEQTDEIEIRKDET